MKRFRPSVAFILRNARGQILIGERSDWPGCWQFPQGGVHPGETPLEALAREVREELGLTPEAYRIRESRAPYTYTFMGLKKKEGYDGQTQTYYLADWEGSTADELPDVLAAETPEFRTARWIDPADFQLDWIPPIKRGVYAQVIADFFGIVLDGVEPGGA